MTYKSIEIFAGCGGMALGLEQSGIHPELLVEIDKQAVETMKANKPEWNINNSDIKKIDFTPYRNQIDIVAGGFPCQPFSTIGKLKGLEDTKGTLFYEFARCVKEVQPKIFIAENVSNLVYHDNGKTLKVILNTFQLLDYKISYKVLDAVNYNVPQYRKRIFIIGVRKDLGLENIYFPINKNKKKLTLKDAILDSPIALDEENIGMQYSSKVKKIMSYVPANGGYHKDLPVWIREKYKMNEKSEYFETAKMYQKLKWNSPVGTLTTAPSPSFDYKGHPEKLRFLNIREYARIQSFPDSYKFQGSISSQYRQIGNAVPCNLAMFLGFALIKTLEQNTNKTFDFESFTEFIKQQEYYHQLSLFDEI